MNKNYYISGFKYFLRTAGSSNITAVVVMGVYHRNQFKYTLMPGNTNFNVNYS